MKQVIFIIILGMATACSEDRNSTSKTSKANPSPETLTNEPVVPFSSYSRRNSDIIDKLFQEALANNKEIKDLIAYKDDIQKMVSDSLENFKQYQKNNQQYWSSFQSHLKSIQDSTLRKAVYNWKNDLMTKQTRRVETLFEMSQQIDSLNSQIGQAEVLIKLIVTAPMMANYQRNELPQARPLKKATQQLERLLQKMNAHTKLPIKDDNGNE